MRSVWFVPLVVVACNPLDCDTDPTLEPQECIAQRDDPYFDDYAPIDDDPCGDVFEPNEDITEATTRDGDDCASTLEGSIRDAVDVDVFRTGNCDSGLLGKLEGTRISITSTVATPDDLLHACIIPMCHDGATNLQACIGDGDDGEPTTVDATTGPQKRLWATRLDSGFKGCCRVGPGALQVDFVCSYGSRIVDTYVWVDAGQNEAPTCVGSSYSINYTVD